MSGARALGAVAALSAAIAGTPPSTLSGGASPPPPIERPAAARRRWEVSLETAQMVGVDNPNHYYFSTQMLSIGCEPLPPLRLGPLAFHTKLLSTFIAAAIVHGPESYYFGWGPQLHLVLNFGESRWSFFGGGGAGLGVADANEAKKTDRGLGQDFTFILFCSAGVRYAISDRWSAWVGGMWHHLSNADLSEPGKRNTGLDEFGAILGVVYAF